MKTIRIIVNYYKHNLPISSMATVTQNSKNYVYIKTKYTYHFSVFRLI